MYILTLICPITQTKSPLQNAKNLLLSLRQQHLYKYYEHPYNLILKPLLFTKIFTQNKDYSKTQKLGEEMSTFSYVASFTINCSLSPKEEPKHQNVNGVKINGHSSAAFPALKVDVLSQNNGVAAATATPLHSGESLYMTAQEIRQNIPTKKLLVDPFRQGLIVEEGVGYRQTVVIRSYEVGPDKTATIESILNLLQVAVFS